MDIEEVAKKCRDMVIEELLANRELRREILVARAKETATKDDIDRLEKRMNEQGNALNGLRGRMDKLEGRMDRLEERMNRFEERMDRFEGRLSRLEERVVRIEGQLTLFTRLFIAFNVPILLGILGILFRGFTP